MALPFFYIDQFDPESPVIVLQEDTSKHIVQVLRMREGDALHITNGKGLLLQAVIVTAHKRNCVVNVLATTSKQAAASKVILGVSLVKNASRFEWFLEKATELGVTEIIPLICERTERQQFRYDRMKGILVSAMLQSQQTWLPLLHEPVRFDRLKTFPFKNFLKLIAHCVESEKKPLSAFHIDSVADCIMLIGPEGDFTQAEIEEALSCGYQPVILGETRLRTETAAVAAAALLKIH
jgi:16S rRNA (uracil1498-N3)-methyltransferase